MCLTEQVIIGELVKKKKKRPNDGSIEVIKQREGRPSRIGKKE